MKPKHLILTLLALLTSTSTFADVPEGNITFADPAVKAILVTNYDTNNDGEISYAEAAAVTSMVSFEDNTSITSFNEFQYFTGVTSIGYNAFNYCSGLTSITIPNSVTYIENYAFADCSGLTSIAIPNSVTSIGGYAFCGCSGLTSITVASGNTTYDSRNNCNAIIETNSNTLILGCKNTIIPNSVTSIGKAFFGCSGLTSITIPNSVTRIMGCAFEECSGLTSITIPNSVTSIGGSAFFGCSGLTSITIPNSVTSIGSRAFYGCSGLTSITVASGNTVYDSRNNCNAIIETRSNTLIAGCKNTIIPNSVTSIDSRAFYGCSGLTSITIPNSVTSIGDYAFGECSGLTSITVASGNTVYDSRNNCNAIIETSSNTLILGCKNTIIPNSVTSIGNSAFSCCDDLTSIIIPNSVTSIGNSAFAYCHGLTSITIPNSVTSIGDNAFFVSGIRSFIVDIVTPLSINSSIFTNQASSTLYVPAGSKEAYQAADYWKEFKKIYTFKSSGDTFTASVSSDNDPVSLTFKITEINPNNVEVSACPAGFSGTLTIPANVQDEEGRTFAVTGIGAEAFKEQAGLTSVTLSEGITAIGANAFEGTALATVSLPSTLTAIGTEAFKMSDLESVVIPDGVTSIGASAFSDCGNLQSVTLGSGITSIGSGAFYRCDNLTSVTANMATPVAITSNVFSNRANATLYVPLGSKEAYAAANNWKAFKNICGNIIFADANVKAICLANWDTDGNGELSSDEAAAVTTLGTLFRDNTNITSFNELQYFTGLTSIESRAFNGCSKLTSITIPSSVTSIGGSAFLGCYGLTKAEFASIAQLCSISFNSSYSNPLGYAHHLYIDGTEVVDVVIPNSVTTIGNYTFYDCSSLTSINIPDGVTSIGVDAFLGCSSLTSINIPEGVTSIGDDAFSGCSSLTSITVESGNIKYDSRNGCNAIIETASNKLIAGCKNTTIPEDVTSIGNYAFQNCHGLTSINIPEGVTSIGDDAFSGCSSLTSITIPESVTSIGYCAFEGCSSLASITVRPLTPPTLSSGAFNSISSDAVIYVPNKSLDAYKTSWSAYASMIQPFYTLTYQAVYNGEVVKSATVEAHPGDAIPAMPEELNCDFVTLTLEGTMPASVSDDHVLSYNVQWNGPFQFSTTEADATWYNLKVRFNKYMHVNETEPYFSNTNATPRELSQAEYQWAFGGNPYEVVLYNRSSDFSKSMTPANGFANHSPVVMRDGTYKWEIGQMNYELADGTNRPDFNLSVKDGSSTAFLNEFAQKELALWVTSNYWDNGNRITTELAPSPNWISGENVSCIAGNKVTIPLSLDNLDDIAGVQFELNVPAGMTLKKASVTSRASAFSASFALASEGVYTLLIIQKTIGETIATIDGHEGVFLNLELEADETMQLGERTITYSDIVLTKADGNTVNTVDNTSTVTIVEPEPGDANRDGKVNVADIVAVANYILHNSPAKFSFDAANVNGDSTVNVADIVGIANIIINAAKENQVKAMGGKIQELDPQ